MENFYKITKGEAELIGVILYEENKEFNPFVGEQTDGTFLISEKMYELLKNTEQFQRVNFSEKQKISSVNLDNKTMMQ